MKKNLLSLTFISLLTFNVNANNNIIISDNKAPLDLKIKKINKDYKEINYHIEAFQIPTEKSYISNYNILKTDEVNLPEVKIFLEQTVLFSKDGNISQSFLETVHDNILDRKNDQIKLIQEGFFFEGWFFKNNEYRFSIKQSIITEKKEDDFIFNHFNWNQPVNLEHDETLIINSPAYKKDDKFFYNSYLITAKKKQDNLGRE